MNEKDDRKCRIEDSSAGTIRAVSSMALYAGQSAGLVRGEEVATAIVANVEEEAESILGRFRAGRTPAWHGERIPRRRTRARPVRGLAYSTAASPAQS